MLRFVKHIAFLFLLPGSFFAANGQKISWYNADSLMAAFSGNAKTGEIIHKADALYRQMGIDTGDISKNAFELAYLEKVLIDRRIVRIKHRHRYRNKRILTIVDYTRHGNKRRFAVVDVKSGRQLFDTLVSQGSGRSDMTNDKYSPPLYFSNTVNSELSSLGMIATVKAHQTDNPCHLCKYAATTRHKDVVVLRGLEKGMNDNVGERDIVIHTTGSKEFSVTEKQRLKVTDTAYHISEKDCRCYHTIDTTVKRIAAYASACGLAENKGYIGQSNGCLVLPEDDHMEIMKTIRRNALIFIYSNVENDGHSYFSDSPIMQQIFDYAGLDALDVITSGIPW